MINKKDKNADRLGRHERVRAKINGTAECPRLNVYRSSKHIYVQLIDDVAGNTLVSASTVEKAIAEKVNDMTKQEAAFEVGKAAGEKAKAKGIETVVFDRGGYIYTGRVQKVAEGAREAGLRF